MPTREQDRILVTGAAGQIGTELVLALRERFPAGNVVAMYRSTPLAPEVAAGGPSAVSDVTDAKGYAQVVAEHDIDTVYHLAAILSVGGEQDPKKCWEVNVGGLLTVLEVAHERQQRLFCPSSIAVFGPNTPAVAPQETPLHPTTMYGVTKVAGEILCDYWFQRYGVDVRGVRYPGLISWKAPPGGGTTDYAIAIFHAALRDGSYECFVSPATRLPMMYMDDAIRGTLGLMNAPFKALNHHADFNLGAMSFKASDLADAIAQRVPGFTCSYAPDARQAIANSWPDAVDDSAARDEWGWSPRFGLEEMVDDMFENLRHGLGAE